MDRRWPIQDWDRIGIGVNSCGRVEMELVGVEGLGGVLGKEEIGERAV